MDAIFKTFCDLDGFKNNVYWGGLTPYRNINYFDIELCRSKADVFQQVDEDQLQNRTVIYQRVRVEEFFTLPLRSHLVDYFSRLGTNDTVEMTILQTNEKFTLTNLRFEDNGEIGDVVNSCLMTFDLEATTAGNCADTEYSVVPC